MCALRKLHYPSQSLGVARGGDYLRTINSAQSVRQRTERTGATPPTSKDTVEMRISIMNIAADRIEDVGPQPQAFDLERATKDNTEYRS